MDPQANLPPAPSGLLEQWVPDGRGKSALDLGAGEGHGAAWLAQRGYQVLALEPDLQRAQILSQRCEGLPVQVVQMCVQDFPFHPQAYDLIVALAVLHFLLPTEIWTLADQLTAALRPGGTLLAQVYTTDDPGFHTLQQAGLEQVEPNTFSAPAPVGTIQYFESEELCRVFAPLEVLHYEEARLHDPDSWAGYRAGATFVGKVAANRS